MVRNISLFVACLVVVCGCGGSGSGGSAPSGPSAQIRMFNDFADVGSVTGKIGSTQFLKAAPFATISIYRNVAVGAQTVTFTNSSSAQQLASISPTLVVDNKYTAIGVGGAALSRHVMFMSDGTVVPAGQSAVRFVNGDENAPSVDIYLTSTATTSLAGIVPEDSGVAYLFEGTPYHTFAPGTYTVWFTAAGHPETVVVKNNVTLTANQEETLFAVQTGTGPIIQEIPE